MLGVARDVAALGAERGSTLRDALGLVARAFADGVLARARFEAFLTRASDEAPALALAWAREQLRLALQELVEREVKAGHVRDDVPAEPLSWVLLAGCEALAHEAPGDADARVESLLLLVGRASARR